MRFGVGQARIGLAEGNFFLVLCAIIVGLIVIAATLISSQGTTRSLPTSPDDHSSSSLGSSLVFSSNSSFIQSTVQSSSVYSDSSLNQSAAPYPLVWGPNPTSDCDPGVFCLDVTLGFAGQTGANHITSYYVAVSAFVQDAVTGQNATGPDGDGPLVQSGCYIEPTGLTQCTVYAPFGLAVPSGDPYKVTLFVTMSEMPCSLQKPGLPCDSQLLAPPTTFVISASQDLAPPIPVIASEG